MNNIQNKKIKILFRHRSMEMGGVEKVLLSMLKNLDREKFDITILLNLNQGELRDEIPKDVRKVWLAEGKEDFSHNPLLRKIQLLQRKNRLDKFKKNPEIIDREILKDKYDIEIAMTYNDFESVLNSSNKNSKKIGWFHSEINVSGLTHLLPMILKSFPKFDQIIYCSEKIAELMHAHHPELPYPPEVVITNAIPAEEILKKSKEPIADFPEKNVPVFVSVGRLHTRKGYHKLMEAHKKLVDDGFAHKILIVGSGEEQENLMILRKKLGAESSFLLMGNRMNPYPYLANADFFILPSESEAWPLVLAEALILQKPSIATNTGDVPAMLGDGKTGILINYNEGEMYASMKKFITDEKLIADFRKNLENIHEKFNEKQIFSQVENLLTELVS